MKQRIPVLAALFGAAVTCTALLCPAADTKTAAKSKPATPDQTMEQRTMAASEGAAKPGALTDEQTKFFESKVRPLLSEHCYKCHSAESEKVKGGLLLDTRDGSLKG